MPEQTENQANQPTTSAAPTKQKKHAFDVEVNGIVLPIYELEMKGRHKGNLFYGPDFDNLTYAQLEQIHTQNTLMENVISPRYRQLVVGISKESVSRAKGDSGLLKESFTKMFTELSPQGETKAALKARREELMEQMGELDANDPSAIARILELFKKIQAVNSDIAAKKVEDTPDDNTENQENEGNTTAKAA